MTDAQILSISITVIAVMAGSIYNNVRISDLNTSINNRFGDMNRRIEDSAAVIRAEMNLRFERLDMQFERTNNKIDALLKLVADIDQRVTSLEARKP